MWSRLVRDTGSSASVRRAGAIAAACSPSGRPCCGAAVLHSGKRTSRCGAGQQHRGPGLHRTARRSAVRRHCVRLDENRGIAVRRRPAKFPPTNLLAAVAVRSTRPGCAPSPTFVPSRESVQGRWFEWLLAQEIWRRRALRGEPTPEQLAYWQGGDHELEDYVARPDLVFESKRGGSSAPPKPGSRGRSRRPNSGSSAATGFDGRGSAAARSPTCSTRAGDIPRASGRAPWRAPTPFACGRPRA